jgi:putative Holliday junction resolvase
MRYLGIDFGTKKVGIAISDEEASFAFPKKIVETSEALEFIKGLVKEEGVGAIVIGESVANSGQENQILKLSKDFAEKLKAQTGLEVFFEREGFSSVEAHRYQTDRGDRDDSAAAIILQRFLDKNKK